MKLVRVGDEFYDAETGEFAGPVDSTLPEGGIETESDLLAYMRRLMRYEAEVAAVELELASIVAHTERMLKDRRAKVDWMKRRYESSASAIAETLLPRKSDGSYKAKTYRCPFGEVRFTSRSEGIDIVDEDEAVQWAEENNPDAVKITKRVLVSQLPTRDWIDESRCPSGFSVRPASTTVKFVTLKPDAGEDTR